MTVWRRFFLLLISVCVLQILYYYPQTPDVMASHFDGRGAANGWSSRNVFFGLYLAMIALLAGIFLLLPRWSTKRHNFGLKIPNRDYWLAPERKELTGLFFQRQMLIMGIAHLLLTIFTIQLAILVNLEHDSRLHSGFYWVLGLYFVFLSAWLVHFHRHFRKP